MEETGRQAGGLVRESEKLCMPGTLVQYRKGEEGNPAPAHEDEDDWIFPFQESERLPE